MFFKTVRENGDSVYARGALNRNYKVGERYKFPKEFPAHVFLPNVGNVGIANFNTEDSQIQSAMPIDFADEYFGRAERCGGNRLLICYGEVENRAVPTFGIYNDVWDTGNTDGCLETKNVSTDFVVIGEVKRPDDATLTEGNGSSKSLGVVIPPKIERKFKEATRKHQKKL